MTETSLYSTIIETTRAFIIVLDVEGRIVMFNNACERLTGYRFEEVKGRHVWDFLLAPEEREPVKAVFRDLRAGNFPNTHENYWVAKSGERRFIEWSNSAVTDASGRVTYIIGTGIDVTGRRDAEAQLRDSQEQFQEVASAVPVVLWIKDAQSDRVYYVSPAFETIWGRSLPDPDSAFQVFQRSIHPDDRERLFHQIQRETELHEPTETDYRIIRPDGSIRWIHSKSIPVCNGAERLRRIVGYAEDITDRKLAEQALREIQQRQRALLDSIPYAAWLKDAAGRYIAVNQAFRDRFGDDFPDPAGKTNRDIFSAETATKQTAEDQEVIRTRMPLRLERLMLIGKGNERWIEVIKVPVIDESGDVIGITGVAHDVTERKLAEAQRIARDAAQREALVKEVHHRIKNNLQGTITLIQEMEIGNPESTDLLETAVTRLNALASLHGLYGTTGERELRLEQVMQRLVSSLQGLHGRLPVQLTVRNPVSARVSESEAVPLSLILNELIMNAIKHSRAADNDFVQIVIENDGNGVRIVIRNRSGKVPSHFNFDAGTGLGTGLALVRSLLPPSGMALRFENAPGRPGTEVELTLLPPVITLSPSPASSPIPVGEPVNGAHSDRRG